jgi:hypothetical protein
MTIIVSAFLENVNKRKDRNTEKYFEYGKKLLSVPIQKIIFMDENCFDMFKIFQNDYTVIIPFKKKNMYFYEKEYFDKITKFNINSTCPEKDTLEYMFTICYKSEFIKDAINYFKKNEQFIWIDFGINHVMKCSDTEFQQKIINMCFKNYDNVRIASIWDVNCNYSIDIYKDISWYFAGGIFGGNSTYLLKFADLVKENCIKIIKEYNTLMWEVNVYFLVYRKNKELFSLYKSDHNNSIIDNY